MYKSEKLKELVEIHYRNCDNNNNNENEKAVEDSCFDVIEHIKENFETLALEDILQGLSSIGFSVSLINDDNGHWAALSDGSQNMLDSSKYENETTYFEGSWIAPKGSWKKRDPRAAVLAWIQSLQEPETPER